MTAVHRIAAIYSDAFESPSQSQPLGVRATRGTGHGARTLLDEDAPPAPRFTDRDEQLRKAFAEIDALPAHLIPKRTYSSLPDHRLNEGGIIANAAAAGAWKDQDR